MSSWKGKSVTHLWFWVPLGLLSSFLVNVHISQRRFSSSCISQTYFIDFRASGFVFKSGFFGGTYGGKGLSHLWKMNSLPFTCFALSFTTVGDVNFEMSHYLYVWSDFVSDKLTYWFKRSILSYSIFGYFAITFTLGNQFLFGVLNLSVPIHSVMHLKVVVFW